MTMIFCTHIVIIHIENRDSCIISTQTSANSIVTSTDEQDGYHDVDGTSTVEVDEIGLHHLVHNLGHLTGLGHLYKKR